MFDPQEIFNRAYEGLRKQGFELALSQGTCQYRTEDGKRCAVGQLIPESKYRLEFENISISAFDSETSDEDKCKIDSIIHAAGLRPSQKVRIFLRHLQQCHDYGIDPADMKRRLNNFAAKHNLTIPTESQP